MDDGPYIIASMNDEIVIFWIEGGLERVSRERMVELQPLELIIEHEELRNYEELNGTASLAWLEEEPTQVGHHARICRPWEK